MIYKTLEGVLNPDGRVILPREELPEHSVPVMVTILESGEEAALSEVGDYLDDRKSEAPYQSLRVQDMRQDRQYPRRSFVVDFRGATPWNWHDGQAFRARA
jgi:hypothetical protein